MPTTFVCCDRAEWWPMVSSGPNHTTREVAQNILIKDSIMTEDYEILILVKADLTYSGPLNMMICYSLDHS